ncbi:Mediator of DNA damage checkpoint protein 1 [Boothiomyces sp. JEL0866]|nr:Mediator of DNA damage checkpoint protein 1 [Boothiomyces sp. JEL0866]
MRIEEKDKKVVSVSKPQVAELHVLNSSNIHKIYNGTNIIGSAPKVDVYLDGVGVSSYHAIIEISPDGSEHFIEDLSSTNGTFLGIAEYRLCSKRMYQLMDNKDNWSELTEKDGIVCSTVASSTSGTQIKENLCADKTIELIREQNIVEPDLNLNMDDKQAIDIHRNNSVASGDANVNMDANSVEWLSQNVDDLVSSSTADHQILDLQNNKLPKENEILKDDTPVKKVGARKKRSSLTLKNSDNESRSVKKQRNSLDNKKSPKILLAHNIIAREVCYEALEKFNAEEVTNYQDCTHLVMDTFRRTVKLCCLSLGKYIVTTKWLEDSIKAEHFLDESKYILKDARDERKFGFTLKTAIHMARENMDHPILENLVFYSAKSVKPPFDDLKQIIEAAGGKASGILT